MAKALTVEEKVLRTTQKINNEMYGEVIPDKPVLQIRKATDRPFRKSRGIFNGTRGKLRLSDEVIKAFKEAGWHLHIFNDSEGRIEQALENGYEFVTKEELGNNLVESVIPTNTDLSDKIRFRVGVKESGEGLFAYTMKIPTVDFLEEQKEIQSRNDRVDQAIRAGKNVKPGTSSDGFYDAGITINTN